MAEQIGEIKKPPAERFKERKKIYLVPLVFLGEEDPEEYKEKCNCYWQQVAEQLSNLESKIGKVSHIYHESISLPGEEGLKFVEKLNPNSYQIAKSKYDDGAIFEAIEENDLFQEVMDWERCLLLGFVSEKVASKVSEFYIAASKGRYEFMAEKLSETLQDNEAGLLFIREGHRLQFPSDIEVFSIFPPALDELHRWLRDRAAKTQQEEAKD